MTDLRRHVAPVALSWDDEAPGAHWRTVPGTLVFADISGFTALTERLAARGRFGAEEIIGTLNRVFGAMLGVAAERGGELLKFGGDALLFLFRGDDHLAQACDAAVEMRIRLRRASAEPTSVGRLHLKMSVGVHSGEILLFLVGAPTRELFVLGPAADATAAAEKAAGAGQIALSPQTAQALPRRSVQMGASDTMLLRRTTAHTRAIGVVPPPEIRPERLRGLFPAIPGSDLALKTPEPEHRTACISFIRLRGTSNMLRESGPEMLSDALNTSVTIVEAALAAEGIALLATDLDTDGAKFFLGSGLPRSSDDDEGRMLRALRRIMDAPAPLPLHAGVNHGHVFAAEVGAPDRAAYTGMGDTTNTAARIASAAGAGEILAHPSVLDRSRTGFSVTTKGPFPMKGKSAPVTVHAIGEEIGARETNDTGRLPFLGRQTELELVAEVLDSALAGAGGVVTISGPAGSGKTRLAREAVAAARDHRLVVVRAEPYGASSAYRVFRDVVRTALHVDRSDPRTMGDALVRTLGRVAPALLPFAPLLADVAGVAVPSTPEADALDPRFRPDRLADAVIDLLAATTTPPIVMVAEEAHWTDAASTDLLGRIAEATRDRPWALIVIRREEEGGYLPEFGTKISIGPLPADVIERLVITATEAAPLRPHEIAAIVERADGNPLFVEEVTRMVRQVGSLDTLPDSVHAALSTQIDLLHPLARTVLRYCSVLGRSFRTSVLDETLVTAGLETDATILGQLDRFLEPDGATRMRFRNSLVRDAAYSSLAYRTRAMVHGAAGRATESLSTDLSSDAATLALHFWQADDPARTWTYARMAGDTARRAYANADAAVQYARALDTSRKLDGITAADRAELLEVLGEVHELSGVLDDSVAAYRRAVRLSPEPVHRAELLVRQARVHERAGSPRSALRVVARARRVLDGRDGSAEQRVRVRLDTLMAQIRLGQERPGDARRWAERAVQGSRDVDDPQTLVQALIAIDSADMYLGKPVAGEHTREALDICIEQKDRPRESIARANLGAYAFFAGRWGEAIEWLASSRSAAVAAGNDFGAAETDLNMAEVLISLGRFEEADAALGDAIRVLQVSGMESAARYGRLLQARVLLGRGDPAAAEALSSDVEERFAELDQPMSAFEATLVRVEARIEAMKPSEALELLRDAEQSAGEVSAFQPRISLLRARALLAAGRRDEAAAPIDEGLSVSSDLPYERAQLLLERARMLAELDPARAASDDAEAARILRELASGGSSVVP